MQLYDAETVVTCTDVLSVPGATSVNVRTKQFPSKDIQGMRPMKTLCLERWRQDIISTLFS